MTKTYSGSGFILATFVASGCIMLFCEVSLGVSPEELAKIEAAVPATATAQAKTPRKLLVFSLVKGNHTATACGAKALELMGRKTGAFEVVHGTDPSIFRAENLKPFDAVCLNNSNRMTYFKDPALQRGLIEFVRGGKGFVGVHAAATNFSDQWGGDWPEGAELVGGIFDGHPWHEKVTIKLEGPDHPLNAAFAGKGFQITDEIYQFSAPYSRDKVRVLLSLDTDKTDMDRKGIKRTDNDFPVSWIRRFGKGRVFYCSLGHDHPVFWNPAVLRHYLDGIQYALGDLPADATPIAALPGKKPSSHGKPTAGDPKVAVLDPSKAGPDFLVQGEYVGKINSEEGVNSEEGPIEVGVQVIALGKGKFHAVGHVGGLPGAGWDGGDKIHADGKTTDGATTFVSDDGNTKATIRDRVMTITSTDGRTIGALKRIVRRSSTLGARPPAAAIALFDGTSTEHFENARMTPGGLLMEPAVSKRKFQSYRSHIEFQVPFMPYARGQARGNNGYFCQGRYQAQILDSFGLEGTKGECGAIYGLAAPKVNMCFPPLSWQTYDVDFTAAEYRDGKKVKNARMTVRHNGVLIHHNVELPATSAGALIKKEGPEPGPVFVQKHNAPLRFRNIWVVETGGE